MGGGMAFSSSKHFSCILNLILIRVGNWCFFKDLPLILGEYTKLTKLISKQRFKYYTCTCQGVRKRNVLWTPRGLPRIRIFFGCCFTWRCWKEVAYDRPWSPLHVVPHITTLCNKDIYDPICYVFSVTPWQSPIRPHDLV